jgi:predicted DNA-binding protein
MPSTSIFLPKNLYRILEEKERETGKSISRLIAEAVEALYVKKTVRT